MTRSIGAGALLLGVAAAQVHGKTPDHAAAGAQAFLAVARVLVSPRCLNCHPEGQAPLQTDLSWPHAQNIERGISSLGTHCTACHQETNLAGEHMPPGAPHWGMPPAETPMVFQNRSPAALCRQLKDPKQNGGRTLEALREHVRHDPIVLWSFDPGDGRSKPPLTHAQFVAVFDAWIRLGAACPE